jgi:malonate-semialdehyde dehydrogenase (acetylating)/methylmalonate-semialdehyde dehydrogenase
MTSRASKRKVPKLRIYVDGQWMASRTDRWLEVHNPATDEVIALCPEVTREEIEGAVKAAQRAFWDWRLTPPPRRAKLLFDYHQKLQDHLDELTELIVNEHGKTYADANGELTRSFEYVQHACAGPELLKGVHAEHVGTGVDTLYIREPLGPFVFLPPFNFPAMIALYFVWAVAAGNTAIIKASRLCPITAVRLIELAHECGFPKGVINLLTGSGSGVGNALVTHPGTVGVTFVGSSRVGEQVYKMAINHGKRAQCQGGAKNHVLIAEDAVLDEVMPNVVNSCFGHSSERCFAVSNVLAVEKIYDEVKERFVELSRKLVLGYGMDKGVTLGPVISREALDTMLREVDRGLMDGAKLILDGRTPHVPKYPKGYFLAPTILEAEPQMRIFQEEVFGPVRCVRKVKDLAEGVDVINRSPYGHTANIYTENGGWAREFALLVNVGQVGINIGTPAPIAYFPVGGRKISMFGDIRGRANEAMDFYTDKKVIISRWHSSIHGAARGLDDGFAMKSFGR